MSHFLRFLFDVRFLSVLGLAALTAFLFIGAEALQIALVWAAAALVLALLVWGVVWALRKRRTRRAARQLEKALDADARRAQKAAPRKDQAELQVLRARLHAAIKTIRGSKLGEAGGSGALYELPWYMIIGNPAAGKSTAVARSGLKFPFADGSGNIIQGLGGTRNCDWFFTTEGILLDTAGRYSVHEEDRSEWLGFLDLLKRNRPKAPINGILIAASVAELAQARPDSAIELAKNLRQRVQELTERLEVFAPVYLVFTKADLVSGFIEFFEDRDRDERDKVWGATLPYEPGVKTDAVAQFDRHFDELRDGLKELALARMTLARGSALPPGVLTFPLEFGALKPALRSFVATLFEDNPYQFRPVFRGFYFTSAVQEGEAGSSAGKEVAQQFGLRLRVEPAGVALGGELGFFLRDLFSRVVFADRNLVRQYTSRVKMRTRAVTFALAVVLLAAALGAWSWSYVGNRQLMANVQADLDKAVRLQADRVDLASRLQALGLLQDRIEQLAAWRRSRPLSVSLGLYQGDAIERKLRSEYFGGVRRVMLVPVAQAIEGYLGEVNQHAAQLQPMTRPPGSAARSLGEAGTAPAAAAASRYADASATNVEDAYNALKTYLMLAEKPRMEAAHLSDQITRFWRRWLDDNRGTMPREEMIRDAERVIGFSMANLQDPAYPVVDSNLGLVDQTRENLRRVVRGMPAIDRVYGEIKARAATRYAAVTVAGLLDADGRGAAPRAVIEGSSTVSGAFTRQAWEGYVDEAFKQAAGSELQSADWVLGVATRDDLSLEGSPDQVRKALTERYKSAYVAEWQRFVSGIGIAAFAGFDDAVQRMNVLGDPESSPLRRVMGKVFEETSWDNPSALGERLAQRKQGVLEWLRQVVLRRGPAPIEVKLDAGANPLPPKMGPIGSEFETVARIVMARDGNPARIDGYLQALGKLRARLNTIENQGDVGPGARQLMAATLDGSASELADALRFVDEQMLGGASPSARASLRPLLVRPLMQTFAAIVPPTETELNRVWTAQVLDVFNRDLKGKYPFDAHSKVEAAPSEIAKVFGPAGAIAKFGDEALGKLVVRRGETVAARTWADMGLRLRPEFSAGFGAWVAPLEGAAGAAAAAAAGTEAAAAGPSQTTFQILPQGSPGLTEYTVTIDGQVLRYRNAAPVWTTMVWPNPAGTPGARIAGVTLDGRGVELLNAPGRFGLDRMFEAAQRKRLPDGSNELSWTQDGLTVTLQLRVISSPGAAPAPAAASVAAPPAPGLRGLRLPALVAGGDAPLPAAAPGAAASASPKGHS